MARGAARTAQGREGAHAAQRRAGSAAAGIAVGSDRQGVSIRNRRRERLLGGPLPRALAAAHLPLHVRAGLHGGVSVLLRDRGRIRRLRRPPGQPRRHAVCRIAGASREAAGVQAADAVDVSLGLFLRRRLQLRLRRRFTEEQQREGAITYNYRREASAQLSGATPRWRTAARGRSPRWQRRPEPTWLHTRASGPA